MIKYKGIENIDKAATEFLSKYNSEKVIAFYGNMGAGKTTFIKALSRQMKVVDEVVSPTFSIINEYHTEEGEIIYHFDFYRIKNLEEAFDLGYEEYFYSGNRCWIEWPEKIEQLLPGDHIKIQIIPNGDEREIYEKH